MIVSCDSQFSGSSNVHHNYFSQLVVFPSSIIDYWNYNKFLMVICHEYLLLMKNHQKLNTVQFIRQEVTKSKRR